MQQHYALNGLSMAEQHNLNYIKEQMIDKKYQPTVRNFLFYTFLGKEKPATLE